MIEVGRLLKLPQLERAKRVARIKESDIPHIKGMIKILTTADPSEDALSAAWTHDAVENRKIDLKKIRILFPDSNVSTIVYGLVGRESPLPWIDQARAKRSLISGMSNDALLVKGADVISHIDNVIAGKPISQDHVVERQVFLEDMQRTVQSILFSWTGHPFKEMLEQRVQALESAFKPH